MSLPDVLRAALAEADRHDPKKAMPRSTFRFGDLSVAMRLHPSPALQRLLPMMRSGGVKAPPSSVVIDVVGGDVSWLRKLLPPPDRRGRTLLRANEDIYYLWLNEADGYLTAIDRGAARGLVWFTHPDKIASWHVARPFLHAIKGLSLPSPWTPIHAASVALNGRGVLIAGLSGAGKSSIAMTCALRGWDYLGDDAVLVRAGPARVAALYNSARLREDTFSRFPEVMAACLRVSDDAGESKAEIDMALMRPLTVGEAEISAILVPQPTDWTELHLRPISRSETLRKLMEAAQQSLIGDEPSTFAKLAAVVERVPCYGLVAGGDPEQLSCALSRLVEKRSAA